MPGSGKSRVAEFFKAKGIPVLRFGDQTEIGLKEHNLPINEKNERWYREKLRKELGMSAMAIKIEPRIEEAAKIHPTVVLDGLYSWEEYVYLKKKFPELLLLCVYAAPKVRYQRLKSRPVRPLTPEEARSRDLSEIENLNKGGPIALADHLIINEGTIEDLNQQLATYFDSLS